MTKLVLKTTAITLAAVLTACLVAFGAFALFSPVSLAKFFGNLGGYSSAVYFYEKQYQKTDSIEDLSVLVANIDDEKDSVKAEEFLADLILHEGINEFCVSEDGEIETVKISTKEYYTVRYVKVLVKNDKFDKALSTASLFVTDNGYTNFNPFSSLIIDCVDSLTSEQLTAIEIKIKTFLLSGEQDQNRQNDLLKIQQIKNTI